MQQNTLIIVVISLLIGGGIGYILAKNPAQNEHAMHSAMEGMTAGLQGKTGDEFDRAFIDEMVVHHEGAVAMAEAALANAKHDEIKRLAQAIISAQSSEIALMRGWLRDWYGE